MAIEVCGLTKVFEPGRRRARRQVEAVRDISFDVGHGERLPYIGPNGAGKSTSIQILTGISTPPEARPLSRRGAVGRPLPAADASGSVWNGPDRDVVDHET